MISEFKLITHYKKCSAFKFTACYIYPHSRQPFNIGIKIPYTIKWGQCFKIEVKTIDSLIKRRPSVLFTDAGLSYACPDCRGVGGGGRGDIREWLSRYLTELARPLALTAGDKQRCAYTLPHTKLLQKSKNLNNLKNLYECNL